jgi:hypothetical protein
MNHAVEFVVILIKKGNKKLNNDVIELTLLVKVMETKQFQTISSVSYNI